jgi:hypothetical protein
MGERPSRFGSDVGRLRRIARQVVGGDDPPYGSRADVEIPLGAEVLPSGAEIDALNSHALRHAGGSGQLTADTDADMRENAQAARAKKSPVNTAYSLEPRVTPTNETNVKGGSVEAAMLTDLSEAFSTELNAVPTGASPNAAVNVLNAHMAKARDSATKDAITKVWSRYVANYGARR